MIIISTQNQSSEINSSIYLLVNANLLAPQRYWGEPWKCTEGHSDGPRLCTLEMAAPTLPRGTEDLGSPRWGGGQGFPRIEEQ